MAWRLAELIQLKNGNLDVVVMDERAEKPNMIPRLGNTPEQQVIGVSNFQDNRSSIDILKDFATVHGSPMAIPKGERHAYARYIPQYEATIPLAFVTYFSKRR